MMIYILAAVCLNILLFGIINIQLQAIRSDFHKLEESIKELRPVILR
jgi:hypothetical protein